MGISNKSILFAILYFILEIEKISLTESILDDNLEIEAPSSYLLSILLILDAIFIWINLKNAGNLPYDDNYGVLALSLMASLLGCIIILYSYFKARKALLKNGFIVFSFLLSSSPISLVYVASHYKEIFGVILAH